MSTKLLDPPSGEMDYCPYLKADKGYDNQRNDPEKWNRQSKSEIYSTEFGRTVNKIALGKNLNFCKIYLTCFLPGSL